MAYKLHTDSEPSVRDVNNNPDQIDLGKIAAVFIIISLISLLTSWFYSQPAAKIADISFNPSDKSFVKEIGPIAVNRSNAVYTVLIKANIPLQTWSFIGGEILDSKKEYLFSFGKELWHEAGRSSDGRWEENTNSYSVNITFPKRERYYMKLGIESSDAPKDVSVQIFKKNGSTLPHLWFGLITLLIGIALNEVKNRTVMGMFGKFELDT